MSFSKRHRQAEIYQRKDGHLEFDHNAFQNNYYNIPNSVLIIIQELAIFESAQIFSYLLTKIKGVSDPVDDSLVLTISHT